MTRRQRPEVDKPFEPIELPSKENGPESSRSLLSGAESNQLAESPAPGGSIRIARLRLGKL